MHRCCTYNPAHARNSCMLETAPLHKLSPNLVHYVLILAYAFDKGVGVTVSKSVHVM